MKIQLKLSNKKKLFTNKTYFKYLIIYNIKIKQYISSFQKISSLSFSFEKLYTDKLKN